MTTIEEELEFRKADAKPSHASLLDISNIGLEDDDDSDDMEEASPAGGPFSPGRFARGVSLPPTGLITCKVTPALPSPTPGPVSYNSFNNITLSLPSSRWKVEL